jgi:hypothetical protein
MKKGMIGPRKTDALHSEWVYPGVMSLYVCVCVCTYLDEESLSLSLVFLVFLVSPSLPTASL